MAKDQWLTLTQAAEYAQCSRKTLYRYMNKGILTYNKKINNRRYVKQSDIDSLFIQEKTAISHNLDKSLLDTLHELHMEIQQQKILLKKVIELYTAHNFDDLIKKHCDKSF